MGYLRRLLGFEREHVQAEEVQKRGCRHDKLLTHTTTSSVVTNERTVIATCTQCGTSLRFDLGQVTVEQVSKVTSVVMRAKGYVPDDGFWTRTPTTTKEN